MGVTRMFVVRVHEYVHGGRRVDDEVQLETRRVLQNRYVLPLRVTHDELEPEELVKTHCSIEVANANPDVRETGHRRHALTMTVTRRLAQAFDILFFRTRGFRRPRCAQPVDLSRLVSFTELRKSS